MEVYYHVIEQWADNFALVGHYDTQKEAEEEANRRQKLFPKSFFFVEAWPPTEKPVCINV